MQVLACLGLIVLAVCLGLKQFATEKEGLAIIVLAIGALWYGGNLLGGREKYRFTYIDVLVMSFLAINFIATCASHYLEASIFGFAKVLVYGASYFVFSAVLGQSRKRVILVLSALLFTELLVSLYGLYQYKIGVAPLATWEDPTVENKGTRIYSTLGNPNLLAGYLLPMVPLSLTLSIVSFLKGKWWLGLPVFGVFAIISTACVLTGSRGGYIGLAVCLGAFVLMCTAWLWQTKPKWRALIAIGLILMPILVALAVHFAPGVEQRVTSIFAGREHSSNSYRLNVWQSSAQMFLDNWWLGIGPGNKTFRLAYGLYMKSGFDALGTYCVPLEIAVETGFAGLSIFALLLLSTACRAHLNFWQKNDDIGRFISAGAACAIFGLMAQGLVDTVFLRPQVQLIFWLCIAIITSLASQEETSQH
jgi:putative inorganic carbon (HCO3(-)) transporter